jgi:peptide/nickel transport system permease protein
MDTLWPIFNKIISPTGHPYSLSYVLFREVPEPLQGEYRVILTVKVPNGVSVDFAHAKLIFVGRTYGLMGTDQFGRDIWADLIWGLRVSLYIGFAVSVTSVLLGVIYGVTSAYFGGWVDEAMQRFNEFMASIPFFPILVLLGMYFGGHITINLLILLLVLFGWMGTAKVARSMALQIKEQTYVEAARALGATHKRIIFKHILPQLLPYGFATIALSVPGAILAEAGLSFLGLGDPTVISWGQMLNAAQQNNATLNGYWWQVIPPGLAIAFVGFVFVLIGVSLDTVLNPRLKRA